MEGGGSLPNKKEKGDYCDIIEILSTTKTDFLIRSNGDLVKTEYLKGKLIAVFFEDIRTSCFPTFSHPRAILKMDLIDAYLEPSQKGDFEVVFVALADDNLSVEDGVKFFDDVFTGKPWLAIPFLDFKSRHHLVNLLYKPAFDNYGCVILDSNGKILQQSTDIAHYFPYYGMDWYPFTDERCIELREEYQLRGTDLKTLLVSPSRDFVISNKGEKVPISELEGKVVGLYLLGFQHSHLIMEKLVKAYEELKGKGENFEIVLVNCHTVGGYMDKKSFEENFRKMPWLALPFKDNLCRGLARNFCNGYCSLNNGLLMIGPGGTFFENTSAAILELYGSEAYPFTRKKAVEMEFNRAKAITMESVIKAAGLDYIFQISGDRFVKIPVSHLQGKRIILYFAEDGMCAWDLDEVIDWYNAIKGKDDSFEVIYVSGNCDEITFGKLLPMMPWLAFPFEAAGGVNRLVWNTSQYLASPSLVAFGSDGRLITRRAELYCFGYRGLVEFHALVQWAEAYPSKDYLLKEMVAEANGKIVEIVYG